MRGDDRFPTMMQDIGLHGVDLLNELRGDDLAGNALRKDLAVVQDDELIAQAAGQVDVVNGNKGETAVLVCLLPQEIQAMTARFS